MSTKYQNDATRPQHLSQSADATQTELINFAFRENIDSVNNFQRNNEATSFPKRNRILCTYNIVTVPSERASPSGIS